MASAVMNVTFRRLHDQRRKEIAARANEPKPVDPLEAAQADNAELRAKNAELETMLAQATAPKGSARR